MKQKLIFSCISSTVISVLLSILFLSGFFSNWQNRLSDTLFLPNPPRPEIIIIAIDDASIQKIGRWPWDRKTHARLVDLLGNNPAVIGYDVSFLEKSTKESDAVFTRALQRHPNIVLAMEAAELDTKNGYLLAKNVLYPIPDFRSYAGAGLVNMITDSDGITRKMPVRVRTDDSASLQSFSHVIISKLKDRQSTLENIPLEDGAMRIRYNGGEEGFTTYSFSDVLEKKIPGSVFKNNIILVGATASDLHDTQLTPISGQPISGVAIHGSAIQTLLDRDFLVGENTGMTLVTIIGSTWILSFLFAFLSLSIGTGVVLLSLILYILYTFFSFDSGIIRNLVYPILAIFLVYLFHVIYKYSTESKQKLFIKRAFSFYVSKAVMDEVLSSPEKLLLGGAKKEITVLFSDIAGFTTISEKLPPEELTVLLNAYLTKMTNAVFKNNGVLDKYIGDAVMAFWGAPIDTKDHALLACRTALLMQKEIALLKHVWEDRTGIPFSARIGINTGEMVVGNMGSEMRFDYTLIGDNVNLGSRLEGVNKAYGTSIIISETTHAMVKDSVIARRLDTIIVKGKEQGIGIYELRGLGKVSKKEKVFLDAFEKARLLYHNGLFDKALKSFEDLSKKYPEDMVISMYLKRIKDILQNPPSAWHGIFKFETK